MIISVSFSMFCDEFNRFDRADNFSYSGKQALFDYIEELEEETGEQQELDIIALCCDFAEYDSVIEAASMEGFDFSGYEEEEEKEEAARNFLEENTILIELDNGGAIIRAF